MKPQFIEVAVAAAVAVCTCSAFTGDKIDVSKVVTKSDAEKILGVAVKDAKGRNQNGTGGYYDSEWSYYAIKGDKALIFDVLYGGKAGLAATMFSILPADGGKSTRIDSLGDKAIFGPNETGMAMLHVLKGNILVTIESTAFPQALLSIPKNRWPQKFSRTCGRLPQPRKNSTE
jgi:hypothetical protein